MNESTQKTIASPVDQAIGEIDRSIHAMGGLLPTVESERHENMGGNRSNTPRATTIKIPIKKNRQYNRTGANAGLAEFRRLRSKKNSGEALTPEESAKFNELASIHAPHLVLTHGVKFDKPEEKFAPPPDYDEIKNQYDYVEMDSRVLKGFIKIGFDIVSIALRDKEIRLDAKDLEELEFDPIALQYIESKMPQWLGENAGAVMAVYPLAKVFAHKFAVFSENREKRKNHARE